MPQTRWPKRFREQAGAVTASEAGLASLFEACSDAADPADDVVRRAARVALRSQPTKPGLRSRLQDFARASTRYSRRAVVAVVAVALLQLGFAFAAELGWHPLRDIRAWQRASRSGSAPSIGAPDRAPAQEPPQEPSGALPQEQSVVPLLETPAVEAPLPAPIAALPPQRAEAGRRKRSAGALSAMPPRLDPLAEEASRVSHAFALLDANPRSALAVLADYHRAFPAGALQGEAALAELRAHLALREPRVALAALDHLAADHFASTGGSASELRISRLELMAGAGRCREALGALDPEIAGAPSARLQGRLLFVRASCRAAAGDAVGSQRDLRQYLHVLPDGPRAAEIRGRVSAGD